MRTNDEVDGGCEALCVCTRVHLLAPMNAIHRFYACPDPCWFTLYLGSRYGFTPKTSAVCVLRAHQIFTSLLRSTFRRL